MTPELVYKALSSYERTLLCGDTLYDKGTFDAQQTRGQAVFVGKGGCISCHNGPLLSDGAFHRTGIGITEKSTDIGRAEVTKQDADRFAFKTPTLRNVSRTAPYFHNGSVADLRTAVRLMADGGDPTHVKPDPLLGARSLTDDEIDDVVAFLHTLQCPQSLQEIGDQRVPGIAPPS